MSPVTIKQLAGRKQEALLALAADVSYEQHLSGELISGLLLPLIIASTLSLWL